jgi:hypothetical protein
MLEKLKTPLDWIQRWVALWQGLVGFGFGKLVEAVLSHLTSLTKEWITPIWLLVAAAIWALLAYWSKWESHPLQKAGSETGTQIVTQAVGLESNIKHVEDFYRNTAGDYQSQVERHFERLLAHFVNLEDRLRFLFRANINGVITAFHDATWNWIFRSQLELLQELNTRAMTLTEAKPFFDAAAAANPKLYKGSTFEIWLSFLKNHEVVLQDGNVLQITVKGKDFLKYLVLQGKSAKERIN